MSRDWLTASEEDRRALYAVTKRVVDGQFIGNWQHFLGAVFGSTAAFGAEFQHNFRKGKLARKHAYAIARWLEQYHPQVAAELAVILEPDERTTWAAFLTMHGRMGGLRILRPSEINVIGLAGRATLAHEEVHVGEEFLLQLASSIEGEAIGFQQSGGQWFRLPLCESAVSLRVGVGTNIVPRSSETGLPLPLCEEADRGIVRFAILVVPGDTRPSDSIPSDNAVADQRLDQIATFLSGSNNRFELHTLAIRVR